jgi:hypothetical protein
VSRKLTPEQKERYLDISQELPQQNKAQHDDLLKHTAPGNERWVDYFQPETKKASSPK